MRIDEINTRLAAIQSEIDTASGEALTALEQEATDLIAERQKIMDEVQTRKQLRENVAAGLVGTVTETHNEEEKKMENRTFTLESEEYRRAFLKNLRREEMTEAETRAFTFLTSNTTAPLPTVMQNRIIDLIGEAHPIVHDVYTMNSNTAITIPVAKAVDVLSGSKTEEGAAAWEMELTFEDVNLAGEDYTANVKLSYRMQRMAIPAFEDYLITQIAARLGSKLAEDITSKLEQVGPAYIPEDTAYPALCAAFGKLKRVGNVVIYGNRETVYNYLVSMVDATGRPLFQPSINAAAAGTLLGATIKFEDAVAPHHLLIGDPSKYIQNVVAPIMIESGKDLDNHVVTYSGYTCQEGVLTDRDAFVEVTFVEG